MAPPPERSLFFQENLAYLKQAYPKIAAELSRCQVDPDRLVAVGEDDWDLMRIDGSYLYGCGAKAFAAAQAERFWADVEPSRLSQSPPVDLSTDRLANDCVTGCLRLAVDEGVQFFGRRCDNSAATIVVYGVGLGQHLTDLVSRSECDSVLLIEPEADLFYFSLFTFDWRVFVETVRGRGGDVGILLSWPPGDAAFTIMSWLNNRYPSLIDGTLFYMHYESDALSSTDREFRTKYAAQAALGWGFVEDELKMIENSVRNLREFEGYLFRKGAPATDVPAFIVGSGPSFDQSVETIKEFRDRALLISCGTALETLLAHGITPDIHTALENVPEAYDVLARCAKSHDIRGIVMIGSTTIDPRIPSLFDTMILVNRGGVSSFPLFFLGDDTILRNITPMVSNLALAFAREAGCRRIFLFGIDLGTRDTAAHHSKESPYMRGQLEYRFKNIYDLEGNFGGSVRANYVYVWSKSVMEEEIAKFGQDVDFFNCSDGARIEGTVPLRPDEVRIEVNPGARDRFKETLLAHFSRFDRATFERQWKRANLQQSVDDFRDRLLGPFDEHDDGYVSTMRLLRRLTSLVSTPDPWTRTAEEMLFRGTLCLSMGCLYFYLARTGTMRDRNLMSALASEALRSLIDRAHECIVEKISELEKTGG